MMYRPSCLRVAARVASANRSRGVSFSTNCAPAQRLKGVLEEYRREHFSRELPSRFRKEVVRAMEGPDKQVAVDSLNIVLINIGRQEACLSEKELAQILQEIGSDGSTRKVTADQIMQLL